MTTHFERKENSFLGGILAIFCLTGLSGGIIGGAIGLLIGENFFILAPLIIVTSTGFGFILGSIIGCLSFVSGFLECQCEEKIQ